MSTGSNTRINVVIHSTATKEEMWEALSRVLPVTEGGDSRWVELFSENLSVTFFGPGSESGVPVTARGDSAPVTA